MFFKVWFKYGLSLKGARKAAGDILSGYAKSLINCIFLWTYKAMLLRHGLILHFTSVINKRWELDCHKYCDFLIIIFVIYHRVANSCFHHYRKSANIAQMVLSCEEVLRHTVSAQTQTSTVLAFSKLVGSLRKAPWLKGEWWKTAPH